MRRAGSPEHGLEPKVLVGVPWRAALALQADGWYLRSDIICPKTLWIWRYREPGALGSLSGLPGEPGDAGEAARRKRQAA